MFNIKITSSKSPKQVSRQGWLETHGIFLFFPLSKDFTNFVIKLNLPLESIKMSCHQESPQIFGEPLNMTLVKKIPVNIKQRPLFCSFLFATCKQAGGTTSQGPWSSATPPPLKAWETNPGLSLPSGIRSCRWSLGIKYNLENLAEERSQGSLAVSISSRGRQEEFSEVGHFRINVFQN